MSRNTVYFDNGTSVAPNETSSLLNGQSRGRSGKSQKSTSTSISVHTPAASLNSLSDSTDPIRSTETPRFDKDEEDRLIAGIEVRLRNVGSVARDHLSSERTFLSYVRTSLALSSAGIALMQFLYLGSTTKSAAVPLGAILIVLALLVLFIGTKRYFLIQRTLITGYFPASTIEIAVISFFMGTLVTVTFGVVLLGRSR